jgi:hypothetical protein
MSGQKQADEQALMAEELHSKIFAQEPQDEQEVIEEEPQPEQETEPEVDYKEEYRKAQARYESLKGKYDKEVPTLHNDLKEFKQQVFERLETQRPEEPKPDRFEKFKEEYGEDLYNTIRELAAMETEEKIKSSLKPVQEHVASVEDTQVKAAQQNFVDYLDTKVTGDWKNLWQGNDPKFIEFLEQPDPSGLYTYGQLIKAYNDEWDADRMSIVFNTYLGQSKPVQRQPRPEKEAMVAPSRQNTHSTPNVNNPTIWTSQTMKEFQENDRLGRYTPEESKAMWDDLLSAPSENRMR